MYFYIDSTEDLTKGIGAELMQKEPYYAHTDKKGMSLVTSISMKVSDRFMMVKMEHFKLNR